MISVFNVGEYRRDAVKFYADKDFFDPDNTKAVAVRKYVWEDFALSKKQNKTLGFCSLCAQNALEDMCNYLADEGEVAIFDATNTTRERRQVIYNYCAYKYCFRVFFVESICDSLDIIDANIRVSLSVVIIHLQTIVDLY